jgi:hypothetical protein
MVKPLDLAAAQAINPGLCAHQVGCAGQDEAKQGRQIQPRGHRAADLQQVFALAELVADHGSPSLVVPFDAWAHG